MSGRARRALGALAILGFLAVYIVAVASFSGMTAAWPWWGQLLFYATAGVAWALPLRPVFVWMGKS